ncbi:hypothetical protein Val02_81830 [Virgisporangium aliadipatigenens]|uniref:Uncharacterized protein n=1 Tax=Virgisporangium aliadipatigenens TaxID=741659 RepID=A0A8J4DWP0_9ACTN|nr:hypothetical protein [Virgisporangium aliadipatigenens]GIJ51297.1 hypothetical protein Val02_81830 [Virgisporangium aliadipatigenens]
MTTIARPQVSPQAVRQWLAILHGDSPGHVHICSTGDWNGKAFADLDAATKYVQYLDGEGREGIYARVTTLRPGPRTGRGGADDSAALPALWADVDIAGPGHAEHDLPPDVPAVEQLLATSGLPTPTLTVHSGGGVYPIWLLDQPWVLTADDLDAAKALAKDWQAVIEHAAATHGWRYGRGVGDLARVLRVPGTINRKAGLARPCAITAATGQRYTVQQLQAALAAARARIAPSAPATAALRPAELASVERPAGAISPLDDYAGRHTWTDILRSDGWTEYYSQDGITYWTRPGKTTGISASTNALGTDRLHVFTTSAAPLEGGESYSKGGWLAARFHGGDHSAAAAALAAKGYGTPLPNPAVAHREALEEILGAPVPDPPPAPAGTRTIGRRPDEIDVSNSALAADWLREEAGRGRLAGLFQRRGEVVHTPREGEEGYVPLGDRDDSDGPAQVRPVGDSALASRISYTYGVYKMVKKGEDYEPSPALFPRTAARTALDVPDMLPNLRVLRGVIHSPVFRPDGTLIEEPGYDPVTGLLHLPEPGLTVPPVPELPDGGHLGAAVQLLDEMLAGFPFVSAHYRANYLGALFTPLLRAMAPPPYKLHAIEAHQPGSGKTLLANLARHIHGGVFRAEMPDDEPELRKQITAILSITTGPIIVIDNVSGALKSSALAGLLTSAEWDDRPLGSTAWHRAVNDRLWTITGNNLSIGGDLPRRTIRTLIDPGRPNPETRTDFAITDLEGWVKAHRAKLLHALLTIVRGWVVAGMPLPKARTTDGYARWIQMVDGILQHAGIAGTFDHKSTQIEVGSDDDEWGDFLVAAHRAFGDKSWTAKELLGNVDTGNLLNPGSIPLDTLPGDLESRAQKPGVVITSLAKSLGRWLMNRDGRWANGLAVRPDGKDGQGVSLWRIQTFRDGSS